MGVQCVYMCKCASLGGSGNMPPPGNFKKLDALSLLLRLFWDRSKALEAT